MTPIEKISLESVASLMDALAAVVVDNGAKAELMSRKLPDLSDNERHELHGQLDTALDNARKLKENASILRSVLAQL